MFDLDPLYNNWLQAWADCIREDGGMPHTAPNPYSVGGGPYWCGFIITSAWSTFMNYGDIHILEKYYPIMQQWLKYVEKYSPKGLLEQWPDTDYRVWFLGDWASPAGIDNSEKSSVNLVNNCFLTICYQTMEKIAEVLGKNSDKIKYTLKREQMKYLVHRDFFDYKKNSYGSGTQIDLTFPLLAGIVPDSLVKKVTETLNKEITIRNKGHIACGLVGIPVVTDWAVKNHETDLMYSILKKKDFPGYLYMIDNGATTTWEHWNGDRSRIHNCFNGIGSWFYNGVGGIQMDEQFPAYKVITINPQIPLGINWAITTKETPYGLVSVKWKLIDKLISFEIIIPVGSIAKVELPGGVTKYRLNNKDYECKDSTVKIESGKYYISYYRPQ
jgi:alpha-L-rhamnosidase